VAALVWLVYRLRIRQLSDQFNMVLAERSRIARELHDTLIQGFSGVTMQMQALCARLTRSGEKETLEDVIQDATQCLREARRSVAGLRGARGPSSGLSAAIAEAARQITEARDVRLRLKLEQSPKDLSMDAEYNLLRIAQEALTNSLRHSGARTIEVSLNSTIESVRLAVKDDGCGFAAVKRDHPQPGHYVLIGMRERAGQIGAEFLLETELGRGTTVSVLLPRVAAGNGHRAPTKRPYIEENGVLDVTGQS
jgi:signal transduction histidine kinase